MTSKGMITAAEEYKRHPELMEEHIENIRDWIAKQPHLPDNVTDELIILIMHSCFFHMEHCKETIDNYFTLRTHLPEFFNFRDLQYDEIQETFKTFNFMPLEGESSEGYKIFMVSLRRTDPHFFHLEELFKVIFMIYDAIFLHEGTMPGVLVVVDFSYIKLGHISRILPATAKKIMTYLQEGLPVRFKGIHYFNTGPYIDKLLSIIKPFMKKQLLDMVYIHQDGMKSLYDSIPQSVFPLEYGGNGGTVSELREKAYKMVEEFQDWFKADERLRVDESKRLGKAKSAGQLFGAIGSFRRLSID